jgi:hypothetical protein
VDAVLDENSGDNAFESRPVLLIELGDLLKLFIELGVGDVDPVVLGGHFQKLIKRNLEYLSYFLEVAPARLNEVGFVARQIANVNAAMLAQLDLSPAF